MNRIAHDPFLADEKLFHLLQVWLSNGHSNLVEFDR